MPKSKEILFRSKNGGRTYEAKRGNLIFELVDVRGVDDVDSIYIVKVQHKVIDTLGFTTCGHRSFPLDKAKEFCQQIADGEIDPEALLMEFAADAGTASTKGTARYTVDGKRTGAVADSTRSARRPRKRQSIGRD